MPLVAAAIAPHGFPVIPALGDDVEGEGETRPALAAMGEFFRQQGVEAVVIAGPHGIRADGFFAVVDAARAAGTLHWKGRQVELNAPCDRPLIEAISMQASDDGLPVARVSFAGNRADQAVVPLDWGALVPLWFLGHDQNEANTGNVLADPPSAPGGPPAVLITPSRSLDRKAMVAFGRSIASAIERDERGVGFIASCDWAHTHREDGPYGFHEAADRVDAIVVNAIRRNALMELIELPPEDVEHAAIDGLWQTLMLAGIQEVTPFDLQFRSYEAPTYYGMIVATTAVGHD
ncbi:MAG TPA: aromatic ring-opening dioxygenase subunit LigB [Thermomicrobiales bacterium]|nr:aromatic ring-opening dioxygenase subunit LigB [Thermomicrobiales bacterium]